MKKKYFIISLIVLTLAFSGIYSLFSSKPEKFNIPAHPPHEKLIAHAGGQLDGHRYTNSLEALNNAFNLGYKFIELDMLETCDGHIVAAHDWKHFNSITGGDKNSNKCLNHSEVMKRKIHNKFTVIDSKTISNLFSNHPDVFLVTDKIRNYDLILQQLNISPDKLLVEVFSYKQYKKALRAGIKYPMFCVWSAEGLRKNLDLFIDGKVTMMTISSKELDKCEDELKILHQNGVAIFSFTENDKKTISKYEGKYSMWFYTDLVKVDEL